MSPRRVVTLGLGIFVVGLAPWQEPLGFAGVLVFVVLTIVPASLALRQPAGERD